MAHELYVSLDEHGVQMKDLANETVRLQEVMNMLMRSIVEIKQHLDYMYNTEPQETVEDEEKPKPKPKPDQTYREMQDYLKSNIDQLLIQALKE